MAHSAMDQCLARIEMTKSLRQFSTFFNALREVINPQRVRQRWLERNDSIIDNAIPDVCP
jgi:hypothetical protein